MTVRFPKLKTLMQHTISITMKQAIAVDLPFLKRAPSITPVTTPSMSSTRKKNILRGVDSAYGIKSNIESRLMPIGIRLMHMKYRNEFAAQCVGLIKWNCKRFRMFNSISCPILIPAYIIGIKPAVVICAV